MARSKSRRLIALITSAALLASLSVATVATPASAAKPKCFGKTATIVGTKKADRIIGTAKRDVIVAKGGADRIFGRGGNDLICAGDGNDRVVGNAGIDKLIGGRGADRMFGGTGPDRLFGGPGPDTIAGQPGNDVIDGGLGVDTCYQGLGTGPVVRCERPVVPPPPASGPSRIPIRADILAIAYSDIDGLPGYSTGDVMIARLVDTDGNGPDTGDRIEMGRYPTNHDASAFGDWGVRSHGVASLTDMTATYVHVTDTNGAAFLWYRDVAAAEYYKELAGTDRAFFQDGFVGHKDVLHVVASSPSAPQNPYPIAVLPRYGDDTFVEVVLNYPAP